MLSIKESYKHLLNFGIKGHHDLLEQRRIKILNELVIWVFLFQCLNYFVLIGIGKYEDIPKVLLGQIFTLIPLILNYFKFIRLSRWLTIMLSSVFIGLMMITMGHKFRMDYAFMFLAVLSVILFPKNIHRFTLALYILLIYFGCSYYLDNYPALSINENTELGAITMFLMMIVFVVILLERFIRTSTIIDKQLSQLKNQIHEKNEMLLLDQFQIENQNISLARANQELETFAYVASHDLKSPLRNITSFLNLIQRRLKNYKDESVHEYLNFATSSAKQMHFLISDILEFSKLGNSEIELHEVDLNLVIRGVINNIQKSIEDKNAVIEIAELPIVKANETQMVLLFQNFIENGIKYNNSKQPIVKLNCFKEIDNYIITIKDNGIGISQEDQEKIFEMFKRLKDKPDEQGSGIGLAICKKIMDQHGWEIIVKSNLNHGTTFFMNIPTK